jgi:hypothetical protein
MADGNGLRDVKGMTVRGIIPSRFRIGISIPLTNIALTWIFPHDGPGTFSDMRDADGFQRSTAKP